MTHVIHAESVSPRRDVISGYSNFHEESIVIEGGKKEERSGRRTEKDVEGFIDDITYRHNYPVWRDDANRRRQVRCLNV